MKLSKIVFSKPPQFYSCLEKGRSHTHELEY